MKYFRSISRSRQLVIKMVLIVLFIQATLALVGLHPLSILHLSPSSSDLLVLKVFALIPQFTAAFLICFWWELKRGLVKDFG